LYILLALFLLLSVVPGHAAGLDPVFGKIDLAFERNEGQSDPQVKFLARAQGYSLFLTEKEAVMRFVSAKPSVVRMRVLGQKKNASIAGVDALSGTTNYLYGDPSRHRTNIRSYRKVRYSDVYPGIDLEYHGSGTLLEYDFVVKPGARPDKIRVGFSGLRGMSVDPSGDLILKTDAEPIVQKKPHVYQQVDGQEKVIEAAYVIRGDQVRFRIGAYDETKPLIIDPVLVYSTFFGGTGTEIGYGVSVDPQGSVYITGATTSTDLPSLAAAQAQYKGGPTDAYVFKLDKTGSQLVYATYIGGSATDEGHSLAVDAGGNAYITGFTQSTDFPVAGATQGTRGGLQDAYILKLNSAGTAIAFSTFLGGSGDDRGLAISLDAAGSAYVTGVTASTNFPTLNPLQPTNGGGFADAFVTKVNAAGSVVYSTYVGGFGNDNPLGIAVDGVGAAYVTGWTTSVNFPLVNAYQSKFGGRDTPIGTDDVFVFKVNPAGNGLSYSTFIGGTGTDEGTRIAVDSSGHAYVTGYTGSIDFPTAKPYQVLLAELTGLDAFILKLAPDGQSLVFSTFFGGFQAESGTGIAVDALGAVYVAGYTTSFDLPTANQIQGFIGGDRDAFVAKFDPAGNVLVFSTFFGGTGTDTATGLTLDAAGAAYIVGFTTSGDLKTESAYQPAIAGGQDVFVAKFTVEDIVSSSQFQVAPQGASSVVTKGTRTDAVFGYAVADPVVPGTQLTGLSIIDRKQNGATVSQVGIPAPRLLETGRLFVDVSSTGSSVLSIANPSDQDATVDFFYTDQAGTTSQFATTTVKAHGHFSRFIYDEPLRIFAPGTLNFTSSIPVSTTSFFATSNEAGELLISNNPIVDAIAYAETVRNQPVTIPQLAEGAGWRNDVILVNPSEDRMGGEVRFFSQGGADQPGGPIELGIGDESALASVLEYDIPPRSFQKISTSGNAAITELPFSLTRGTSFATPGAGAFQVTGFASADLFDQTARINGLQIIEYRQLGITHSQMGVIAPSLRESGQFFAETTETVRSFLAIANPNAEEVTVQVFLTDQAGASAEAVTLNVPASGQKTQLLSDQPVGLTIGTGRTVNFTASLPVFVSALRFTTNERNDTLQSAIPISDAAGPVDRRMVIPYFADGVNWKSRLLLVNNTDEEMRGEVHFLSPDSTGLAVGVGDSAASVFEYHILPRSFFELQTNGVAEVVSTGSVHIIPFPGFHTPLGHVVVSNFVIDADATAIAGQTVGYTIFETSVEAQLPATGLRLYAEAIGDFDAIKERTSRTIIAIANPSAAPATVQLEVRSFDDAVLGVSAPLTIAANGQFGGYLQQVPGLESLPAPFQGVIRLTVLSGSGVTATSFRIFRNERLDYLVTTTGPLNENAGIPGRLVFPYVTDSTGYTTRFILINPPGVQNIAGILHYFASDATPLGIDTLKLGFVQVVPFGGFNTPHAHVLLIHRDSGVLTSIIGVEGQVPIRTFRMYAESLGAFESGKAGSVRSGIALANPSEAPASVTLEIRTLDGTLLRTSRPFNVPASGQVSMLLNEVPGFETLPVPVEGVVRVTTSAAPGVTGTAIRAVYNERGNTIFTTTGPLIEDAGSREQVIFPHIAEGGGYTTQFIVIGGASGQGNAGTLSFFTGEGNPLNLTLTTH
jgi:hypothetical protein